VSCVTDLMVKEGLINLDFADVRTVMQNMGTALMGTGEAEGDKRALHAAEAAISNPLLGDVTMRGAKGLLVSITGSFDMTLYEVEEAASRIRREVDPDQNPDVNIIVGATFEPALQNRIRVSVVATGIAPGPDFPAMAHAGHGHDRETRLAERLNAAASESGRFRFGAGFREQNAGGGRQSQDRHESGRAALEPKGKKSADHNVQAFQADAGSQLQRFEPLPPGQTVRPPKRPLTYQDFPELNRGGPANRNGAKPRGFFDWVAGRNKDSGRAGSVHGGGKSVTLQQRSPHEKLSREPELNGHRNGYPARSSLHDDGADLDQDGLTAAHHSDEVTDIPEFFKKPMS
jgi:cell division protein FtsZ